MKFQNGIAFVAVRVDPSCSSGTRGKGPIDRANKRCERTKGCDTVGVGFVLDPLVVSEGCGGGFSSVCRTALSMMATS